MHPGCPLTTTGITTVLRNCQQFFTPTATITLPVRLLRNRAHLQLLDIAGTPYVKIWSKRQLQLSEESKQK